MTASAEQFHQLVQHAVEHATEPRLHAVDDVDVDLLALLEFTGRLARDTDTTERWRWRGHEAARQVASYLTFLQPPAGWHRIDATVLDEPACGLVWTDGVSVFADVLATVGRDARLWTRHTSGLPRRLVRTGQQRFGDGFVGVRVAAVAAPAASLLVTDPTGPPVPLATSPWWFHPAPLDAVALVAAAAGEVAP